MSPFRRVQIGRLCDAVVHASLVSLLAFAPLALGSVHAWSLATVQLLALAPLAAWGIKTIVCGGAAGSRVRVRRWFWPLAVFGAVASAQLVPLPPAALNVLSPRTAALYRQHLPGWPQQQPLADVAETAFRLREERVLAPALRPLSSPASAESGKWVEYEPLLPHVERLAHRIPRSGTWRSLSLYRYRGGEELLRMAVWAAVFFCS